MILLLVVVPVLGAGTTTAASAQEQDPGSDDPTTTTSQPLADPSSDIIPEPNSGRQPDEAGDRGGTLQLGLLALIVAAVGGIVLKVVHDSRRARSRAGT